jgi:hypothetical protein
MPTVHVALTDELHRLPIDTPDLKLLETTRAHAYRQANLSQTAPSCFSIVVALGEHYSPNQPSCGTSESSMGFSDISVELSSKILGSLDYKDMLRCERVSTWWRALIGNDHTTSQNLCRYHKTMRRFIGVK